LERDREQASFSTVLPGFPFQILLMPDAALQTAK